MTNLKGFLNLLIRGLEVHLLFSKGFNIPKIKHLVCLYIDKDIVPLTLTLAYDKFDDTFIKNIPFNNIKNIIISKNYKNSIEICLLNYNKICLELDTEKSCNIIVSLMKKLQNIVLNKINIEKCPICLETPNNVINLECRHSFCEICIKKWNDKYFTINPLIKKYTCYSCMNINLAKSIKINPN